MTRSAFERVEVFPNADEVASAAAHRLVAALQIDKQTFAVCLTGGSGPQRLYALLAAPPWRDRIPWTRTHWFIGDERFVPASDDRNNMQTARNAFLDQCTSPEFIHPIPTNDTLDGAAQRYQKTLQSCYGAKHLDPARPLFDFVLMGVGPDGHTASLFPTSPDPDPADWVVGVAKANVAPFVPRVSLTIPTLASTLLMLFLASGTEKQAVLTRIAEGENLPAKRAAIAGNALWLIDQAAAPPSLAKSHRHLRAVIVMGVSASGKSTVGELLAKRMDWDFLDGDTLHSPANIEKMKEGRALDDKDRQPWLEAIAGAIANRDNTAPTLVIACSALKRSYRDTLIGDRDEVRLVYLKGEEELIAQRLDERKGHFMNAALLGSQFDALQEPQPDEHAIVADISGPPDTTVDTIVGALAR